MNANRFAVEAEVKLSVKGKVLGGKSQVLLLREIDHCGSITHAAKAAGISYKTAWDTIEAMNHIAGTPLVVRAAGGKGGGGSQLTERGRQLVQNFAHIEAAHQRYLSELSAQTAAVLDDLLLLRRLSMKTSARNQFLGTVCALTPGVVNDEVTIRTADGIEVVAIITHESCQRLGLQLHSEAFALVKSSNVMLLSADAGVKTSARNQYGGQIVRLLQGAVNTEVLIALNDTTTIAATVTNISAQALGLDEGGTISALFKASGVILAVPA